MQIFKKAMLLSLLYTTQLMATDIELPTLSMPYSLDTNLSTLECQSAEALFKENSYDVMVNLRYGLCALKKGDIDSAMAAFDRAEILDEENYLVHQCMGDMHAKIGNFDIAMSAYDKADSLCPIPVKRASMKNKHPNKGTLKLQIHRGYDDNVKLFASIYDLITWFGAAIIPSEALSDMFTKEFLQVSHFYDSDLSSPFYYKTQFQAVNIHYDRYHEDNIIQGLLQTGPAWAQRDTDTWVPISFTKVGIDQHPYSESLAFRPQILSQLNKNVQLKVEAAYEHTKYLQWSSGDYSLYSIESGIMRSIGKDFLMLGYSFLIAQKDDKNSPLLYIDNYYHQFDLGYIKNITPVLSLNLDFLLRVSQYDDPIDTVLNKKRYDTLKKYSIIISYKKTEKINFYLQFFYNDNETNYLPYDYSQSIISCGADITI